MSGGDKQTTTATNTPYKGAEPLLNKGMGDALKLYNKGGLVKPNTQSTVVPYSQQSTQGMGAMSTNANANMGGNGLSGQFQGIIDNGGYNSEQMDALSGIRETANSTYNSNANPGFADVLRQAQEGSMYGSNANAQAMGRYGSGTHQGVQQRELGDLTSRMVGADYNQWLGRRDNAQQQLFNAGQQGQSNLGSAYDGMQAPIDTLMGVGAMNEDLMGRVMNDQLRINQEKQNAPLANIQALLAAASGAGSYGTQTQTAQGPNNTMSNIAGGLLGGASFLNGMKQF